MAGKKFRHCEQMDSFVVSGQLMKHALIIACWITVLLVGIWLRFDALGTRPFHADEATGARITATRMESGGAAFDPTHYHGPLLSMLAIPLCKVRGEHGWLEMTQTTLRILPFCAGVLLVLLPLIGRRRFGDAPMLLAAALLATSPLLVYYSRMFIHEMLLALFGMAFLFSLLRFPRHGVPGFLLGLMFATKETFAISVLAWSAAAGLLAWENRRCLDLPAIVRNWRVPAALCLLTFLLTAGFLYTDAFTHPRGAVDAVRTFFVYKTVDGHDKPPGYYLQLLALPQKSAGLWWFGTPVLLLALWSYASTFRNGPHATAWRPHIRFLAYSVAGHFIIYSLFAYKTPWLACLPWAHVCLLAGFSMTAIMHCGVLFKLPAALLAGISLFTQFQQSRAATGRMESDTRNPFAYVPTRKDVVQLELWLGQLRKVAPGGTLEPMAVIGSDYWPLPWYLRSLGRPGYWKEPPAGLASFPLVFAMPESAGAVMEILEPSHMQLPRGLRTDVPLFVFVRNDLWELWMNADD